MTTIRKAGPGDVCLWPDGSWCMHEDLGEHGQPSGDYEVIAPEDPRYQQIAEEAPREYARQTNP